MAFRKELVVRKKDGKEREGRGFSRDELKKASISFKQALHLGLPVDVRRRTIHGENVKLIKRQLKNLKIIKERVSKAKKKTV